MTLEFEKISDAIELMGRTTRRRQALRDEEIGRFLVKLRAYAGEFAEIERCLQLAQAQTDEKWFRAAIPLNSDEPLDQGIAPGPLPDRATLVATDGSQILPDRHAPFLYYLINIGGLVYYHGDGRSPEPFTAPQLRFPGADLSESTAEFNSASVSIKRDLAEIGVLAEMVQAKCGGDGLAVALLDQRLLYWPIGSQDARESHNAVETWLSRMEAIRECQALLAGYIDEPGKTSVLNMLAALDVDQPDFDSDRLLRRNQSVDDADLFSRLLQPGERSPVFIDISNNNQRFARAGHEICFFYFNPSRTARRIARVDLPIWVAKRPLAVAQLHALLYHQCQILLGDYPYALVRADEVAVVGRRDQAYLDSWIGLVMDRHGLAVAQTSKQSSKEIGRGGRTRHEM